MGEGTPDIKHHGRKRQNKVRTPKKKTVHIIKKPSGGVSKRKQVPNGLGSPSRKLVPPLLLETAEGITATLLTPGV
jgi:hypothetical protein